MDQLKPDVINTLPLTTSIVDESVAAADTDAEFNDRPINCIDCRDEFIWTAGEQRFFSTKGLVNPPKRCKPCKKAKNERIEAATSAANGERPHITVRVTCDTCGRSTTVPFYPSQGRPVLCRECFQKKPGDQPPT